jgi:lipopolysaccharide/colanic/teichoic acid biosynthesis glycosyltransferase
MVLFDVSGLDRRGLRRFIDNVLSAVRSTDHVGWLAKSTVAVLLPFTGHDGAKVFLAHFTELPQTVCIPVELYSYPDAWIENASKALERSGDDAETRTRPPDGRGAEPAPARRHGKSRQLEGARSFTQPVPTWKRAMDIAGALFGLIALSPILVLVGLYIKIVSPGPVLFTQKRVGMGRKEFTFFKFRTMRVNNDESYHAAHARDFIHENGTMDKLDQHDPRIIPGGRILRRACIDELPQLLNVLRGEMSLVGPRPCIPYEAEEYLRWHTGRFSILPGLSGLWQVSGKNKLTFQQMIRLDIAYEKRMSLGLDLWIVMMTFPTIAGLIVEAIRRRSKDAAGMTTWVEGFALAGRPFAGSQGCVDPADDHHRMRHTADVTGS